MIQAVAYGLAYVLLRFLSLLPLWLLNILGWFLYQFLKRILKYRKKIILRNIKQSFPGKESKEVEKICSDFYRYFSRMIVENIKVIHLSKKTLGKYVTLKNPELLEDLYRRNIPVAGIAAHYGNWEWLQGMNKDIPYHSLAIYKPLNDKYFDAFFSRMRTRLGTEPVSMRDIPRVLLRNLRDGKNPMVVFIADQSPVWEEVQYWIPFMNQDTAVYLGPEKLARKFHMAVIYSRITVKPGNKYEVEFVKLTEDASLMREYELTKQHVKLLEEDIKMHPEYWLWSHRRWKLTERREREEASGICRFDGSFKI